ncbi:hypothetical protein LCGC14_1380070 [marine sediment metagenome]|uniref:VRR-NUC domain-containing protein n=1 Tax=marine sediment metagenome TaxID=412755 RepID=A0A0F9KNS8_9ZZZZ
MTRLEKEIKRTIEEYLSIRMAQGKLIFFRLNTGNIIIRGEKTRRFKGCGINGASDFLAITNNGRYDASNKLYPINILIECKSDTGKISPDQIIFQETVEKMGCMYILARKLEDVSEKI